MLKKILLAAIISGGLAAIPLALQSSPDLAAALLRPLVESAAAPEPREAEPARAAQAPLGRSVTLDADPRGHFVTEARMNGRRIDDAVIDTGASVVAINRAMARRLGLTLAESDFRHEVRTANGRTRAAVATIERLEIGRLSVDGVQAVVLDDSALEQPLIGMSFLNRLRRYGVEAGRLVMEQ